MKIIVLGTHFFCVSPNKNNMSINCQQLAVIVVMDDRVLNVNKKFKPNAESKYAAKPPSLALLPQRRLCHLHFKAPSFHMMKLEPLHCQSVKYISLLAKAGASLKMFLTTVFIPGFHLALVADNLCKYDFGK